MVENDSHIISKLKQQPRHGMATDDLFESYKKGAEVANSSTNVLLAGFGKMSAVLKEQGEAYIGLVNKMKYYEDANTSLQQAFGLNIKDAAEMGATLDGLSKKMGAGGADLRKYQADLKGLIGGFAGVTKNIGGSLQPLLQTQTIIQKNLKLSGEQANKFIQYSAMVGESADVQLAKYGAIADTISNTLGYQVSARDLVADLAGLSEDLQLQYGKMPEKLALANLKAKALGLTMGDLHKTGMGFLNIESSIGDELEYQLLSGHRLVDQQGQSLTNAYREATIKGESGDQAKLMNQILEQEGDVLENNLFARQQMAKLLNTDEATIARSLSKKKLLSQLGVADMVNASFETMQEEVMKSDAYKKMKPEDQQATLKKLFEDMDTRTTDQKMLDSLDTLVSIGLSQIKVPETAINAQGTRMTSAEYVASLSETRSNEAQAAFESFQGPADATARSKMAKQLAGEATAAAGTAASATTMFNAFKDAFTTSEFKNPWTVRTSGDVTLSGINATGTDDIFLGAGSNRAILGPEGMFTLNNKDSIVAGTNLNSGGGSDVATLAAAIIGAIKEQTNALTTPSNSQMNSPYYG